MRIVLFLLFVLGGGSAFAESPPAPTPSRVEAHDSNTDHQNTETKRDKEERGSEKNPLFIKQVHPEIKTDARENKGKTVGNWINKDWPEIATTLFTFVLALSTIALWISTRALARLSRDEFNATHRPQIIIHTFEKKYLGDGLLGATFTYVNVGTAPASIVAIESNIYFSDNIAAEDSKETVRFDNKFLKAGEKDNHTTESSITDMTAVIEGMKVDRGQSRQRIMCQGRIIYADSQGTSRETGFCRVYDGDGSCWLRVDNSDYEYAY